MVNIDRVYQRVLFVANKEQRGYITPDEFNSYADQAQKEVFESYFLKKFQTDQAPGSDEDYSNPDMIVDEKIALFDQVAEGIMKVNGFYPSPSDLYRLDHVSVPQTGGFPVHADEVSHKRSHYINLSPLTSPTISQPVYIRNEQGVNLFPNSYTGPVNMFYVRQPVSPLWASMRATAEQIAAGVPDIPYYDAANSQNFELHAADEQDLVYKILTMAGVSIKQADISGYGQGKDQQTQATEV